MLRHMDGWNTCRKTDVKFTSEVEGGELKGVLLRKTFSEVLGGKEESRKSALYV